jgi:hypothetical protein
MNENIENSVLCEISQAQKYKYYALLWICGIQTIDHVQLPLLSTILFSMVSGFAVNQFRNTEWKVSIIIFS